MTRLVWTANPSVIFGYMITTDNMRQMCNFLISVFVSSHFYGGARDPLNGFQIAGYWAVGVRAAVFGGKGLAGVL